MEIVQSNNAKMVKVRMGKNPRPLYPHQVDAITALNQLDSRENFSTLVVLPTGAGKTMTASTWLLRSAVDKKKKILWIAHRHLLLEQAAEAFISNAFSDIMLHSTSFKYRIVSGQHDRPIHIKDTDDILIVSKDSIIRNLAVLDQWLDGESEVYLVIDEAHHATAKSYRRIIDYVKQRNLKIKILGLTATPLRTSKQEQGLLGKIFTDEIAYKIDLVTLINRGILSTPICESCNTEVMLGDELGLNAIKSIEQLDVIPEDIAEVIADNGKRNRFIVKTYFENIDKYGQTIVFALNRIHAFTLKALFEEYGKEYGIKAGVIVSGVNAEFIGIDISNEENARQIEAYRNGEIQVLINVNILTEGIDLPKTQTVFLTRPTISTVLMTQMIGRALRGEKAGGTKEAYIVSFVDNWNNKIAWANPQSILEPVGNGGIDSGYEYRKRNIQTISIEKIEEFARIVNDSIDTSKLESVDFMKRVPLGMYVFTFIDENNMEHNHQILVYDNSEQRYQDLVDALPDLFIEYGVEDENIDSQTLSSMLNACETTYFDEDMIPPYNSRDIEYLLKYFAQKESKPLFIPFDKRIEVDLSVIAKKIKDKDMRRSEQREYINSLWEDETSLIKVYFGNKYFFQRQLEIELDKLYGDFPMPGDAIVRGESIDIESKPLYEIHKIAPNKWREIKDAVFADAKFGDVYCCAECGKYSPHKVMFQIDHIYPMSKGGLTKLDNLQLLCRRCNLIKGDKV